MKNNVFWTQQRHCNYKFIVAVVACTRPTQNQANENSSIDWRQTQKALSIPEEVQWLKATEFRRVNLLQENGPCKDLTTIHISTMLVVLCGIRRKT